MLEICRCAKLTSMASPVESNQNWHNHNDDDQSLLHCFCDPKIKFGGLQYLRIEGYDDFRNMWCQQIPPCFFEKLTGLSIRRCGKIQNLFSLTSLKGDLSQLESLNIEDCEMMKEVFLNKKNEMNETLSHVTFPKLNELILSDMPSLTTFSKGIGSVDFPVLKEIGITNCSKLVRIVSSIESNKNLADGHSVESLHLFCSPKVKFGELQNLKMEGYNDTGKLWCEQIPLHFFRTMKRLEILGCYGIKSLFSYLAYENFVNLEDLTIRNCNQMERVIAYMKEIDEKSILFPHLDRLSLENLPLLGMFCECRSLVELPSLRNIFIGACPQMQFLTLGSLSTPNLKYMMIKTIYFKHFEKRDINEMGGLNGVVYQHIFTRMTQSSSGKSTSIEHEDEERERKEESSKDKEKDKEIC